MVKTWTKAISKFYLLTTCTWCGMQIDTLLITYSFNVQMGMYFHSHKFVIGQQQVFFLKVIWIWMQRFFNLNWQLKVDHGKEGKCQVIWLSMYRVLNGHVTCSSKNFTCQVIQIPPRSRQWEHLNDYFLRNTFHGINVPIKILLSKLL